MTTLLTIGEVSQRAGVAPSALRFYEEQGLISSVRSAGNQRRFKRDVLRRVAVIRAAQHVGLSLEEIGGVLAGLPTDRTPRQSDWAAVARRMRSSLDWRIDALEHLRELLEGTSEDSDS